MGQAPSLPDKTGNTNFQITATNQLADAAAMPSDRIFGRINEGFEFVEQQMTP
jgi:hypothetical protein